jgi:hypothetical protein
MLAHEIGVLWAPTHLPSLNFCSSSSKVKLEVMQEIRDNTSVDPCLDLPNGLMRLYLMVHTYPIELFVEFFTLSWAVERWNLSFVSLLLSLFLKLIGENMVTMILWLLNLRHSGTLFGVCFLTSTQQIFLFLSYPLKAKYVELMGKDKGYNSSHVYCQVKGWYKKSYKIFSNNFGKGFWNGMMEGEKMESHQKEFLKLKCFSPLKILTSTFIWRDSWSFFSCSVSWGLGGFDDIWGENRFFRNLFSTGFNILAVNAYSGMELCTLIWLKHDYGDEGVMDILVMDAYSRVEVCTLIFLGVASN